VSEDLARPGLAIGELVARTGVSEGTLRMWERRHDFPTPERLPSGHRRYSEDDVERVQRVLRERAAGLSLAAAIARVHESDMDVEPSIFAGLRRRRPELQPFVLRKPAMLALSRAIEDESCARAEVPLLFGSFQEERFYRQSERRWRDFWRTAELTCVFADFERVRLAADGPAELPIDANGPLLREWAVVCEARGHAVCLAGVELPAVGPRRDSEREFEVIWSVEPAAVRVASDVCAGLAARAAPELADRLEARASLPPAGPPTEDQLRLAATIITRTLSGLA
jgi:MerR family transcriptional regulator, light-induced transcriptional regulator